jgi:hypothetical protein
VEQQRVSFELRDLLSALPASDIDRLCAKAELIPVIVDELAFQLVVFALVRDFPLRCLEPINAIMSVTLCVDETARFVDGPYVSEGGGFSSTSPLVSFCTSVFSSDICSFDSFTIQSVRIKTSTFHQYVRRCHDAVLEEILSRAEDRRKLLVEHRAKEFQMRQI